MIVLASDTGLRTNITEHEGLEIRVYPDSDGIPTIGVGYNMTQPTARADFAHIGVDYDAALAGTIALNYSQIQNLLTLSLARAIADAVSIFPSMGDWPINAQYAVVDMSFTLGKTRLLGFHQFIAAMQQTPPDYINGAVQAVDSKWGHKEAPTRAMFDATLLRGCASNPTIS